MTYPAIVLAAGKGRRFGGGKLTAAWRGAPLVSWSVAAALRAADEVIVVAAPDETFPGLFPEPVRVITAGDCGLGIAHSLRAGLTALPSDAEGVFIFLGDMPMICAGVGLALRDAMTDAHEAAAPLVGGQRGHPVLVRRRLFPQLLTLTGDHGAGALLTALGPKVALVPLADEGLLFDVDRRDDLVSS